MNEYTKHSCQSNWWFTGWKEDEQAPLNQNHIVQNKDLVQDYLQNSRVNQWSAKSRKIGLNGEFAGISWTFLGGKQMSATIAELMGTFLLVKSLTQQYVTQSL